MDKFLTAIYAKGEVIIIDISVKSDSEKIDMLESFIEKNGVTEYKRKQLGDILTILVYFNINEQQKSREFLDNLYKFID
jgi:hypothetical protein